MEVYIPCKHATAVVEYKILQREFYQGEEYWRLLGSRTVHQKESCGWEPLDQWYFGREAAVLVEYDMSRTAQGRSGASQRSVGMDAVRIRRR